MQHKFLWRHLFSRSTLDMTISDGQNLTVNLQTKSLTTFYSQNNSSTKQKISVNMIADACFFYVWTVNTVVAIRAD